MKINATAIIFLLIGGLVGLFWWHERTVSSYEQRLATVVGHTDTVKVVITLHDTTVVHEVQTVYTSDTTILRDSSLLVVNDSSWQDTLTQPLFKLSLSVNPTRRQVAYAFKYKPLTINLQFADYTDLRKGFTYYTDPPGLEIKTDWGSYVPLKKPKVSAIRGGIGYGDRAGPSLAGAFTYRNTDLLVTAGVKSGVTVFVMKGFSLW